MRFTPTGVVATDHIGAAVATPYETNLSMFQQPVNDADEWQLATRPADHTGRGTAVDPEGANMWASGGTTWMRRLDTGQPQLRGSAPWQPVDGFVGDVSQDGRIAVTLDKEKSTLFVYADNQLVATHAVTPVDDGVRLSAPDGKFAVWVNRGALVVVDTLTGVRVDTSHLRGPFAWPMAFTANGELWIVTQTDQLGGIVFKLVTPDVGYVYGRPLRVYDPDVHITSPSTITLGWTQDKGKFDIMTMEIDLTAQPMALAPATVPVEPTTLPAWPRKMWVSPFFSYSLRPGIGSTTDMIGNAQTLVGTENNPALLGEELGVFAALGQPLIVSGDQSGDAAEGNVNLTVAWWVAGADITQLGQHVRTATQRPAKPVIAYLDRRGWPDATPSWVTSQVWPSVQVYRAPSESVDAFRTAVIEDCERVTAYGQPFWLTLRMDDYNGNTTEQHVVEVLDVYTELATNYPVIGLHLFSDRRGNGMAKLPTLRAWAHAATAAAIRPSRWDYWTAPSVDSNFALIEKLKQDVGLYVLSAAERQVLLGLLQQQSTSPATPPMTGPMGMPPNMFPVVEAMWAEQPPDGTNAGNLAFCSRVARRLAQTDPRWGLNWKRGNVGDPSVDIISYKFGPGDDRARIVDIIGHSEGPLLPDGSPNPGFRPTWSVHSVEDAGAVLWFPA